MKFLEIFQRCSFWLVLFVFGILLGKGWKWFNGVSRGCGFWVECRRFGGIFEVGDIFNRSFHLLESVFVWLWVELTQFDVILKILIRCTWWNVEVPWGKNRAICRRLFLRDWRLWIWEVWAVTVLSVKFVDKYYEG